MPIKIPVLLNHVIVQFFVVNVPVFVVSLLPNVCIPLKQIIKIYKKKLQPMMRLGDPPNESLFSPFLLYSLPLKHLKHHKHVGVYFLFRIVVFPNLLAVLVMNQNIQQPIHPQP